MRKNTRLAYGDWTDGKRSPASQVGSAVWTDGTTIYSYRTAIVTLTAPRPDALGVILNRTKYSVTTTIHQNALAQLLRSTFAPSAIQELDDLWRGIDHVAMRAQALAAPELKACG